MAEQERAQRQVVVLPGVDRYRVTEAMFEGVRVVLAYRGEPYTPEYVQGISGAAFRLCGPCPCAPTCGQAMEPVDLVRQLGYEVEPLPLFGDGIDPTRDVSAVIARVKEEIRRGRPVLLWHAFTTTEWDVVCGYDDERGLFLGRGSYAGLDEYAVAAQGRTATCLDICPCLGAILVGERTGAFDSRAAEVGALREAVHHAHSPDDRLTAAEVGVAVPWRFRNGLGCYEWWVNAFVAEPSRAATTGEHYCLSVFRSTHAAAAGFLRELAGRYPEAGTALLRAAGEFTAEAKALSACAAALFPDWRVPETGDPARNAEAARLLGEAQHHYEAGIGAIEQALGAMGSTVAPVAGPGYIAAPARGREGNGAADSGPRAVECGGHGAPMATVRQVLVDTKPGFAAAGCYYRGCNTKGEIKALWDDEFIPRWGELRAEPFNGSVCYGLERMPEGMEVAATDEFEYLACLAVDTLADLPAGMVGWQVPAATYAITRAGSLSDLPAAFDFLYRRWLPQARDWSLAEGPCIEYYPPDFAEKGVVEVWVPVRPVD